MQDSFLEAFHKDLSNLLADTAELIAMDTPSDDPAAVSLAMDWLETRCRAMAAETRRFGEGDILQADFEGSGAARILVLCHADTVFAHGEAARRPFRVEGERAYGPGVADMKGGIAMALGVVRALRAVRAPYGTLRLLFTGDEEMGAVRSRDRILESAQGFDAALVLEPGRPGGEVVSARKGVGIFHLEAHGRAAHAGVDPHNGRSAIAEISRRIVKIAGLNGRLPDATINVGVVRGGSRPNVVAEQAHCDIDIRIARLQDETTVHALLRDAATIPEDKDVRLVLTGEFSSPPMEKGPGTQWLLSHARAAAEEIGMELQDIATGGGSDGNRLSAAGIPVLDALGPVGGRAHSTEEYVEVQSIPERAALLAGLILHIARERAAASDEAR